MRERNPIETNAAVGHHGEPNLRRPLTLIRTEPVASGIQNQTAAAGASRRQAMNAGAARIAGVTYPPIVQVSEADRRRVIATIVAAFVNDPVERWLFPELADYEARFGEFVAAFAGEAFERDGVWRLGDFDAVALWLAPGARVDETAITEVLTDAVASEQHQHMFSVLEQMDRAHPTFEHWYLPWLGVVAGAQGKGLGGQLLEHGLARVDQSHLPAFLETPNPRTIAFYERQGFVVTAESQSGDCPPVTSMLREAR